MHQVHDFKQKQPPACDIWYKNPCGGVFWPSQTLWAELGQFLCELQLGEVGSILGTLEVPYTPEKN